tara:strand:- start:587 stop:1249 length:663 start_codon:yes stop_codon:yes gene_type:complete
MKLKEEYYNLSKVIEMYNKVYDENRSIFNFLDRDNVCGKESYMWSSASSSFGNFILLMELLMWLSVDTKYYALKCLTSDNLSTGSIINDLRTFLKVGKLKSDDWMTYIGWCDNNQWYKIGRSKSPLKRCEALSIKPVLILNTDVETVLLNHHDRIVGEWVEYDKMSIKDIVIEYYENIVYFEEEDDGYELERKSIYVDAEFSKDLKELDDYSERVKYFDK